MFVLLDAAAALADGRFGMLLVLDEAAGVVRLVERLMMSLP